MKKLIFFFAILFSVIANNVHAQTTCPATGPTWQVGKWDPVTQIVKTGNAWRVNFRDTATHVVYGIKYISEQGLIDPSPCNFLAHDNSGCGGITVSDILTTTAYINGGPFGIQDQATLAYGFYYMIYVQNQDNTYTFSKVYYTGGTPCGGCGDGCPNALTQNPNTVPAGGVVQPIIKSPKKVVKK